MAAVAADMHTHTTCSDGALSPEALVRKAGDCGLQALAITDHDTIDAIEPATQVGEEMGISIIPGVELSVQFRGRELHMLGYYFDQHNPKLQTFLLQYQEMRTTRAKSMVGRLNELGINLDFEDVRSVAEGPAIGRPHVAQALVNKGYVDTVGQAFLKYLRNRGPADVAKELPPGKEAIEMLHEAGGIAVLAHPGNWVSDKDLDQLKALGLDGVEVIHPSHDEILVNFYVDVAHKLSLLTTGGSDFHGQRTSDEKNLGTIGFTQEQFEAFQEKRGIEVKS